MIHKKIKNKKYNKLLSELIKLGIQPEMLYDDRYYNTNHDLGNYDATIKKERAEYKNKWGFNYQLLWDLELSMSVELYIKLSAFKKYDRNAIPIEFENKSDEWEEILNKMINAFRLIIEQNYSIHLPSGEYKTNEELGMLDKNIFYSFSELLNKEISDEDKEELDKRIKKYYDNREEENKQIKEGLDLFAKHFRNLWG